MQDTQDTQNMQNMKNMKNMQNMQNMQNIHNMQNMQNVQNMQNMQKMISESESSINSRTCLGHLVLFITILVMFAVIVVVPAECFSFIGKRMLVFFICLGKGGVLLLLPSVIRSIKLSWSAPSTAAQH